MIGQPLPSPQASSNNMGRGWRIACLVFVGLVVLCGLAGSCLFAVTLVLPLFTGTPTP